MRSYAILVTVSIIGVFTWMYVSVGNPVLTEYEVSERTAPHTYSGDSSIENIDLLALYFVPSNKTPVSSGIWKPALKGAVDALVSFHGVQLYGRSVINAVVHDVPVIGGRSNLVYDSDDTRFGNPFALRKVGDEITRRLSATGDLESLRTKFGGRMPVIYVLYEGVGAAGSEGVAFLGRRFLTQEEYKDVKESLFAHEFYHTIDVPDGYTETGISFTHDLMGLGRERPLGANYLSREILKNLGL